MPSQQDNHGYQQHKSPHFSCSNQNSMHSEQKKQQTVDVVVEEAVALTDAALNQHNRDARKIEYFKQLAIKNGGILPAKKPRRKRIYI